MSYEDICADLLTVSPSHAERAQDRRRIIIGAIGKVRSTKYTNERVITIHGEETHRLRTFITPTVVSLFEMPDFPDEGGIVPE